MAPGMYSLETPLGKVDITKFDGTRANYQRWSCQARAGLKAIDAWQLIEGDLDVPGEESSERERRHYRTLNNKGFALIYNSVDEKCQLYLDKAKDSCLTAWKLLEILHSDEQTEVKDLKKRKIFGSDSERVIEKWRKGRRESIEVQVELLDELKQLDDVVEDFVLSGTLMRVAGNAMIATSSTLGIFYPPARAVAGSLSAWGRGVDLVGVGTCSLAKLSELGLSKMFLSRVEAAIKADIKNTNEMIRELFETEEITPQMLEDLARGLATFFRRRYGKKSPRGKTEVAEEKARVPAWKEVSHCLGVPLFEWQGDNALSYVGVAEAARPACLHGALLAWNVYYLMSTRGLKSQAQYVTYVEAGLKKLKEELEASMPHDKDD